MHRKLCVSTGCFSQGKIKMTSPPSPTNPKRRSLVAMPSARSVLPFAIFMVVFAFALIALVFIPSWRSGGFEPVDLVLVLLLVLLGTGTPVLYVRGIRRYWRMCTKLPRTGEIGILPPPTTKESQGLIPIRSFRSALPFAIFVAILALAVTAIVFALSQRGGGFELAGQVMVLFLVLAGVGMPVLYVRSICRYRR